MRTHYIVLGSSVVLAFSVWLLVDAQSVTLSGVRTDFFGVAAQIIPVLVLAFLVEARSVVSRQHDLIRSLKNDIERESDGSLDSPSNRSDLDESLADLISLVHRAAIAGFVAASFGEVVALFAFAAGSENMAAFVLVLGTIGVLAWALIDMTLGGLRAHSAARVSKLSDESDHE